MASIAPASSASPTTPGSSGQPGCTEAERPARASTPSWCRSTRSRRPCCPVPDPVRSVQDPPHEQEPHSPPHHDRDLARGIAPAHSRARDVAPPHAMMASACTAGTSPRPTRHIGCCSAGPRGSWGRWERSGVRSQPSRRSRGDATRRSSFAGRLFLVPQDEGRRGGEDRLAPDGKKACPTLTVVAPVPAMADRSARCGSPSQADPVSKLSSSRRPRGW